MKHCQTRGSTNSFATVSLCHTESCTGKRYSLTTFYESVPILIIPHHIVPYCGTSPKRSLKNRFCNSVYLEPVTDNEIMSIIKLMNPRKSVSPYSVPVKLLHIIKVPISRLLAIMVNESFIYGNFPNKLRQVK